AGSNSTQRLTSRSEASFITPYKEDRIASITTKEIKAGIPFTISKVEFDAQPGGGMIGPSGSSSGKEGGSFSGGGVVKIFEETVPPPIPKASPTPQPTPKPKILTVSKILNGSAIVKPAPPYPHLAKITRVSGLVAVQILIDEQGRVVSAQPASGHPMLRQAAMQAAYQARFSPTYLGEHPVKVSGVITYNFVLQ
ncbi:MAG TPA: TonB family protein, partial [Pyrinomonadaceae bacterium]|nr:TonB family protein [Pyrinomonadaceae bacterium]